MKTNGKVIALIAPLLFLSSCMHRLRVTSTALAQHKKIPNGFFVSKSFCVVAPEENLFMQEVKDKIEYLLIERGYYLTDDAQHADYIVKFAIRTDKSLQTVTKAYYSPGKTKIINTNVFSPSDVMAVQEQQQTSGTYTYVPEDTVIFNYHLTLSVYDAYMYKHFNKEEEVWHAQVESSDISSDQRLVTEYLLKSAFKNFGKDTRTNVYDTWLT